MTKIKEEKLWSCPLLFVLDSCILSKQYEQFSRLCLCDTHTHSASVFCRTLALVDIINSCRPFAILILKRPKMFFLFLDCPVVSSVSASGNASFLFVAQHHRQVASLIPFALSPFPRLRASRQFPSFPFLLLYYIILYALTHTHREGLPLLSLHSSFRVCQRILHFYLLSLALTQTPNAVQCSARTERSRKVWPS